uniref:Uncharacterized protein n=1 Tax=Bionectria ochroleuca TaxID=29856 RepID=A0A8H7TPF2_BIOOC
MEWPAAACLGLACDRENRRLGSNLPPHTDVGCLLCEHLQRMHVAAILGDSLPGADDLTPGHAIRLVSLVGEAGGMNAWTGASHSWSPSSGAGDDLKIRASGACMLGT